MIQRFFLIGLIMLIISGCTAESESLMVEQWKETRLNFISEKNYANPYTDIDFYAVFTDNDGKEYIRPGFWKTDNQWQLRFSAPEANQVYKYQTFCSDTTNSALHRREGRLKSKPYEGNNPLLTGGFLKMSPGKRNLVQADGTSFLIVGDTPWALPWRSTYENTLIYAKDRQSKGFNTALLMTIQPDRGAEGPDVRNTDQGFARAFSDLPDGHINQIIPEYFDYYDSLTQILIDHGIVPVHQPVFHGFGWKGKQVLGWNMNPAEYERYSKYLLARYGARPAIWLVSGDSNGKNPGVAESGEMFEKWDCYAQPAGIHYNPFDRPCEKQNNCGHLNKNHQSSEWLDFQWCQTGHGGQHIYYKVADMYRNEPIKAVANGESTYEGIRDPTNGSGWWQGEEAWMQLMQGSTMGFVYGAGGLWQWKISPEETGWPDWANSRVSWREALDLEGSKYVGLLSEVFKGLDFADMEKIWEQAGGKPCLGKPGKLYIAYLNQGGEITLSGLASKLNFRWFNPVTGLWQEGGAVQDTNQVFTAPNGNPWVLVVSEKV